MTSPTSASRITAPPVHLPFMEQPAEAEFRWRLGVRPLDLAHWFEWGDTGEAAIAAKPGIIAEHSDTVFALIDDGIVDESEELAELVVDHLVTFHPDRRRDLDGRLHPLDAAARLVPDDLALLVERDGRLVFGGGSVCFPNEWDLQAKLGRTMSEVHEPVGLLNAQIGGPIDHFFERLVPERSWWRLGWGLIDTDDWFAPPGWAAAARVGDGERRWWLRVERESLRRLPRTGAVAFSIRTHLTPLADLDDAASVHLAARLARLPDPVADYKSITGVRDALVEALTSSEQPAAPNDRPGVVDK